MCSSLIFMQFINSFVNFSKCVSTLSKPIPCERYGRGQRTAMELSVPCRERRLLFELCADLSICRNYCRRDARIRDRLICGRFGSDFSHFCRIPDRSTAHEIRVLFWDILSQNSLTLHTYRHIQYILSFDRTDRYTNYSSTV